MKQAVKFCCLFLFSSILMAAKPVWTVTPAPGNNPTQTVTSNGSASVDYVVQNQSHKAKTLAMLPISGITQIAPCSLAPVGQVGSSCTIHLAITGSALSAEGIHGGPVLCQTDSNGSPNPNQCYQPAAADVLNITNGGLQNYTIGGSISGLNMSGLVLQNNGGDNLAVSSGASSFVFSNGVPPGGSYNVTVLSQPIGLTCSVTNGSGVNVMNNINSVSVTCNVLTFTVGGDIAGLSAAGLVLQNIDVDNLPVTNGATSFVFSTPVAYGGTYNVTVLTQPTGLICTVSNGAGVVTGNVTTVDILCSSTTYTIGGNITNLTASGLVLRNNGGDNLAVTSGAPSFDFGTPVAAGSNYNVTVFQQPVGLICVVTNGSGTNVLANVTSVEVTCRPALAYVSSSGDNNVFVCGINNTNNTFTSCTTVSGFNVPQSVTINAAGTWAYVANSAPGIMSGNVVLCSVDGMGLLTGCAATGSGVNFDKPEEVKLNQAENRAYVLSYQNGTIQLCSVSGAGVLSGCANTLTTAQPTTMVLNNDNTLAFIGRGGTEKGILICEVNPGTGALSNCGNNNPGSVMSDSISSIALTANNTRLYVSTRYNNNIWMCTVNGSTLNSCVPAGPMFTAPEGIALNANDELLYVNNYSSGTTLLYDVNANTGLLTLNATAGTGFNLPQGITLK